MFETQKRRRAAPGLSLAAALLTACSAAEPDFGGPLSPRGFTLGGETFTIALPEQATISTDPGGAFMWVELRPGARSSPSIWLETPFDQNLPFPLTESENWGADLALDYRTELTANGSGGPEASLDGRLRLGARAWSVSCRLQGEQADKTDAVWCLPLLATLKPAAR